MSQSLRILSSGVKFALNLLHFMINFEFSTPRGVVTVPSIFDDIFTFGLYCIFVSFEIGTKNRKSFINPIQEGGKKGSPYQFFTCNFYKCRS